MTTPSTARKAGPLLGNGSTTSFPFAFKVFSASDIAVTIANSAGVETQLVLNTDYSVTVNANQDTSPGGTVTYPISGPALPSGSVLVIVGDLDYDQSLDLPSGGNFSPLALENQLDRTTMQMQQLKEQVDRSAKLPVTYTLEDLDEFTANIVRLGDSADNIDTLADNISDITTVASDLNEPVSEINTVAGAITNVNTVGNNIANVNTVAGAVANVNTVATNIANVNAVAGNATNVNAVAGNATNINAVAGNATNINAVAGNATNINAVAGNATNVNAVAGNATNIDAVAGNATNININATNIAAIQTNANNIAAIQGASANATAVVNAVAQVQDGVKDRFVGGVNYTINTSTQLTLSATPLKPQTVQVYFSGVYQEKTTYTLSGNVITFGAPIAAPTVEVTFDVGRSFAELDAAVVNATNQAATATTQAGLATTQANTATTQANAAASSASAANVSATGAATARSQAEAAASASGSVRFYNTKAAATADLANIPADGIVEVLVDESLQNARTRYRKESVALVFRYRFYEPELISVKQFGAVGNGVTDDSSAINSVLTAYPNSRIYFPTGTYLISSPLLVRNHTLVGDGPYASIISTSASFTGDAVIRALNRDNNNANVFDKMTVRDLQISCTKAISGIDLCGTRNATLDNLYLSGPGVSSVGSMAIRVSDNNRTLTSIKSTFFFSIRDVNASGTGWETFLYYEQRHQNCGNGFITNVNSYSKFGVQFGPNNGSAGMVFMRGYMYGGSIAGGQNIFGTIPASCFFIDFQSDLFATTVRPANWGDTFTATMLTHTQGERPITRGTTASPQPFTSGFSPGLDTGAFILSIPAGRTLTAGVNNRFGIFTNSPKSGNPEILLDLQPVSGLPLNPIQMSGFYNYSAGGSPIYVDIVTSTTVTLTNNLLILIKLIYTQGTALATYNAPA